MHCDLVFFFFTRSCGVVVIMAVAEGVSGAAGVVTALLTAGVVTAFGEVAASFVGVDTSTPVGVVDSSSLTSTSLATSVVFIVRFRWRRFVRNSKVI